jgi:hypothetical protein
MDASYQNVDGSLRITNQSALKTHSTNPCKYFLFALGIISLIGGLVAAGCLYFQLGHASLAIGGGGIAFGVVCYLLSKYCCASISRISTSEASQLQRSPQVKNNQFSSSGVARTYVKRSDGNLKFNRLPCKHEGNSCFVNTALQTMAHLSDFRRLFDQDINKLEKASGETGGSFQKRKKVQEKGHVLINRILKGEQAENLGDFSCAVNNALTAMGYLNGSGEPIRFDIQAGGDAGLFMYYIRDMLTPNGLVYEFQASYLNQFDLIKESLSQEKDLPTILAFCTKENCSYHPEIVIDGLETYRLEAVTISVSNHSKPIIRSQSGQFFVLDDMVGTAEEISEDDLSNILIHNKQSLSAYYVKVI